MTRKNSTSKTESQTFNDDKNKFDRAYKHYLSEIGSKHTVLAIMSGVARMPDEHDWLVYATL